MSHHLHSHGSEQLDDSGSVPVLRRLQLLGAHAHYLNEADWPKRGRDWGQLGVVSHQHVLDARLAAVQGQVPGHVVAAVHLVFCYKEE